MATYDQMYQAAVKQAHERSEREGETMVIYRSDRGGDLPVWYVRSVTEDEPENAGIVEMISCFM